MWRTSFNDDNRGLNQAAVVLLAEFSSSRGVSKLRAAIMGENTLSSTYFRGPSEHGGHALS